MPERLSCVFCDIVAGSAPSSIVDRDGTCTTFLDIQPINAGHLLVVPNAHAAHLADLDPTHGAHMFRIAMRLAAALRGSVRCEGVNLILADGAAAGQEVFHAHLHVIPRFAGDGFGFTFPRGYLDRPERAELDRTAAAIRAALA